jgi:hypothetical protein
MQTDIAVTIYEKVKGLSPDKQEKVLEFLDALDIPKKSIWDKLDDRLKDVPQEELAQLPADASANLEHYLYGSPKK